jgi:hypothetical protein
MSDGISKQKCFARLRETGGSERRASISVRGFEDVPRRSVLEAHFQGILYTIEIVKVRAFRLT